MMSKIWYALNSASVGAHFSLQNPYPLAVQGTSIRVGDLADFLQLESDENPILSVPNPSYQITVIIELANIVFLQELLAL
jgi:hypothetical protein